MCAGLRDLLRESIVPHRAPPFILSPAQHSRAGEGQLQMQPIEATHELQVARRHRPRQVVNAATADVQRYRTASRATACPLSGRNSTYRPVQISGASSTRATRAGMEKPYNALAPALLKFGVPCRTT